jgi:hypothetical protein
MSSDNLISELKNVKKDISTLTKQVLDIADKFKINVTPQVTKAERLVQKVACYVTNIDDVKKTTMNTIYSFIDDQKGVLLTIIIFAFLIFIIPMSILFLMIGFYSCAPSYVTILSYILTLLFIAFCIILIVQLTKDNIRVSTKKVTDDLIKNLDNLCK